MKYHAVGPWDRKIPDFYTLAYKGTCNVGMTASTTSIVSSDLIGFGDDYFNDTFYLQVVKNANSIGNAPSGEYRKITDYTSLTGTFTTDAFSSAVQTTDEIYIVHAVIVAILSLDQEVDYFMLQNMDNFDVADADADTARWNPEYITAAAGGSADINTTTSGKLYILADYNVGGACRYAVSHNLPFYGDFCTITEDVNVTWGATAGATAKAVGIGVSAGTAYDSQNYIFIERQKGTGVDRIQIRSNLNNAGEVTTNVAVTDDILAFKLERWDETWRVYYSTTQSPNYDWILASRIEDPTGYMTNQYTFYQQAFNGAAGDATETAQGDFDNFKHFTGGGGGGQFIAGDYDSTWVSGDVDGCVLERQEALQAALQIVAGGGTGFEADGTGLTLYKTLVSHEGLTTSAGSTTTIVDTALTTFAADYWNGNKVMMIENNSAGVVTHIVDFDGTSTLTLDPALPAASSDASAYVILNNRVAVPPAADSSNNRMTSDVVGAKDDTIPAMNAAPSANDSLVRHTKAILERVGATPADPDDSLHTVVGQRDATADTTAGTASHSAILNAMVAGLGLVDAAGTGFEADGTGHNLFELLVAIDSVTTGAGTTATYTDSARTEGAGYHIGNKIVSLTGSAAGQVRTIVGDDGTDTLTIEPVLSAAPGSGIAYVILKQQGADWILGANTANNAYDSSTVAANDDGSVLERLEFIQTMLVVGEGTFTTGSATEPIDTSRAEGDNFWNGCLLMPLTGSAAFQPRLIVDYDSGTDKFYVDPNQPFTAATGTVAYVILSNQGALAPAADQTESYTSMDVVGNKADAAPAMNAVPAATDSVVMHLKAIRETVGQEPADGDDSLHTVVGQRDAAIPAMNAAMTNTETLVEITSAIKERLGATPADSDDPLHTAVGQRDAAATSDDLSDITTTDVQAKLRRLLLRFSAAAFSTTIDPGGSARTNLEDLWTDLGAMLAGGAGITTWPAAADIGNGVSLAEGIRAILNSLMGDDDFDGWTNINNTANTSLDAALQNIAATIGADGANVFNPTIGGSARTDLDAALAALGTLTATTVAGKLQIASTTIDLNQIAASYDLFTGTTQDVVLEKLIFRLPNVDVSDDAAITSISIQTDDVTSSTILSSAAGAVANLTAEAQLAGDILGGILIKTSTKIQLTIAGGAADVATVCDVIAHCRAVVNGGYLA